MFRQLPFFVASVTSCANVEAAMIWNEKVFEVYSPSPEGGNSLSVA